LKKTLERDVVEVEVEEKTRVRDVVEVEVEVEEKTLERDVIEVEVEVEENTTT
jgi:hypothetical protein